MLKTMQNALTWAGMARDVEKNVRSCLICTKNKHPTVKYGKLPEKTVVTRPWFEVAIDSIGPYGKQKFGVYTMVDTTTRLVERQAVADASSDETAYLFDRLWLCRYPRPGRSYGITAESTTTRNPQASSIIERLHRHARKIEQVRKNNLRENAGRRAWAYQPGDRILLKRDGNINSKLTTLYDGPYTVLAVRDNGTLVIDKGRYTETVHIPRVVPYKDQRGEDCELPDKTQRGDSRKQTTA
ncbi:hypothetical protein PHYSODRAFT_313908 [Phytophthora sojae]|uniref:Integrase zinc-binding domain-containing protein n=1 Tax=Phytophthora sojae (strain P6497) TaxID=1094619 RepID=G4Z9D8_PHYSP|nr:hypothetical protein PHYSODRAFT_313908 [Phytophthora sojae]EGZ21939.1 hypothetical protein PHYSODRAFT_313908 [Phytophthora sojae]|eukprot:XP_009524656.1 hypothetical protein PHYSODRAFT_313908 [Phytophthora sojae]